MAKPRVYDRVVANLERTGDAERAGAREPRKAARKKRR